METYSFAMRKRIIEAERLGHKMDAYNENGRHAHCRFCRAHISPWAHMSPAVNIRCDGGTNTRVNKVWEWEADRALMDLHARYRRDLARAFSTPIELMVMAREEARRRYRLRKDTP